MNFYIGLDLGQAQDFSAIAIVEKTHNIPVINALTQSQSQNPCTISRNSRYSADSLDLRRAQRFPLGAPYSAIIESLRATLDDSRIAHNSALIVDATGVGAPIVERLRALRLPTQLVPVIFTGGYQPSLVNGVWHVPKRDLISNFATLLEAGTIRIARALPTLHQLMREFDSFTTTVNPSGVHTYGAAPGEHDDLIAACALAFWYARPKPPIGPQSTGRLW